jgi:hypothetical protein
MKYLVLILMLVGLLVGVSPALASEGNDGVRAQAWDYFVTSVLAVAGVVVVLAGLALSVSLSTVIRWGLVQFINADQRLENFGRTPYGMALYAGAGQLARSITPHNPYVVGATNITNDVLAEALGLLKIILPVKDTALTSEEVSHAAGLVVRAFQELVNGTGLPSDLTAEEIMARLKAQG